MTTPVYHVNPNKLKVKKIVGFIFIEKKYFGILPLAVKTRQNVWAKVSNLMSDPCAGLRLNFGILPNAVKHLPATFSYDPSGSYAFVRTSRTPRHVKNTQGFILQSARWRWISNKEIGAWVAKEKSQFVTGQWKEKNKALGAINLRNPGSEAADRTGLFSRPLAPTTYSEESTRVPVPGPSTGWF